MVLAVWLMLPAYLPNPFAAVFGGGRPIDGGKTMSDGRRILGDGKTFRGFFAGLICGTLAGLLQMRLIESYPVILGAQLPTFGTGGLNTTIVVFALAFGSLFGDMFMSFFKRRMGLKRGAPLPVVDQLDFVMGALIFAYLASPYWFSEQFTFKIILVILIITPLLHLVTNIIGYFMGVKKEPW
ncbi:CDP-2,3-bis-(O-geranylgeranyl)-sn-glycerol synthase [Methanococcoides sp. LMO-2]|uniref:CDP-archaeol synthase n=1 Tax=Methanococcoides cohabitans TaxID=3136559 RepID=A0ABU9KVJ0_9EURY